LAKILGIDPGSRFLGYGALSVNSSGELDHMDHGVISVPKELNFAYKLAFINKEVKELLVRINPDEVVVEKIFLGKNADSAFKLGHVRGVILSNAAERKLEIYEYAPKKIKKMVTGNGGASKEHVRAIVSGLLRIEITAKLDASDALSLALGHVRLKEANQILTAAKENQYDSFA